MTIFGTFLTRSGMIASVHSFAKSSIGNYFVVFIVLAALACAALIVWRLPLLRAEHRIDSLLSRDFVFLLNNWILLGMLVFVLTATTWPLISEALRGQTVTVGPGFYNKWMVPLGLILLSLTGIGPLLAWRKSTGAYLYRVLLAPGAAALVMVVLHCHDRAEDRLPAVRAGRSDLRHHDRQGARGDLRRGAADVDGDLHVRRRRHRAGVLARHARCA